MPSLAFIVASTMTCTRPPISRAKEDTKLKLPFATMLFMLGARITARCATGVVGPDTTLRNVTASDTATTAHVVAMMELTAFTPMISAMRTKTVRSIPLTLTLNAATVPLLTMTLMSKGR